MSIVQRGGYRGGECELEIDGIIHKAMTCAHCSCIVVLEKTRTRPRGHCDRCARYICDECAAIKECTFIDEMVDLALTYPGEGPFLNRAPGELLDDRIRQLRDKHRIAGIGVFYGDENVNI